MRDWTDDAVRGWSLLSLNGEAHWFATKQEDGRKRTMGGRLVSHDQLFGTIRNAEALGWDLYLSANPAKPEAGSKRKLAREDIAHWRYVVVDLDPTPDALAPPSLGLDGAWWNHSRIFSGRGYQLWVPVKGWTDTPPPPNAELMMKGYLRFLSKHVDEWAPGWKVDTACSDLARVVRCPGSVNQKTGKRSCVEQTFYQGRAVDQERLIGYVQQEDVIRLYPPILDPNCTFLDVLPHLNGKTKQFILYGVEVGERHNACYAACKNLYELGVDRARALDWLYIGSQRCWQSTDLHYADGAPMQLVVALEMPEIRRTVERVYGGGS